ncbi:MAG TPA: ATP-binding protein [Polyangiaceae bacterium]|jgi:two-component system sensor histidine kinase KdpD|nr:ATP-binding protein [Polyangiaceae bacterium]
MPSEPPRIWQRFERRGFLTTAPLTHYALAIPVAAASSLICEVITPWAQLADFVIVYLLGVVAIAARCAPGPSLFAAMISILSFDYFFIPPLLHLSWPDAGSVLTFVGMVVVAGVISGLNQGLRKEREAAQRSEAFANALYGFSQALSQVHSLQQLSSFAERRLAKLFDARVHVALESGQAALTDELGLDSEDERRLALSAWRKGELIHDPGVFGLNLWLTLKGAHRSVGLLGMAPRSAKRFTEVGGQQLLLGCASQLAGAVERLLLSGATHRAELQAETERTRSSLLAAVSHDLRNPLAAILTAASTAARADSHLGDSERRELMRTIMSESERLNRLVSNLLSMTKLESGELALQRLPEDMAELIDNAVRVLSSPNAVSRVSVHITGELPAVDVDAILIEQVLINLLENALRHTPAGSPIEIEVREESDGSVLVRVIDHGEGIRLEERQKVFEKFFRGSGSKRDGGAGLGLTICRAAVVAHRGRIRALETPAGGATIEFTLPRASLTRELEDD